MSKSFLMQSKSTKEVRINKDLPQIKFDPKNCIAVKEPLLNSWGLDLTNPDLIKYSYGTIDFEVIGGINDNSLNQLKVTLRIKKKASTSPVEIYRTQQVDLFNDGQLDYVIKQASERTRIELIKMREGIYALAEKLEQYKRDRIYNNPEVEAPKSSAKSIKETKDFLKQKNLLESLKLKIEQSGCPDARLGLKLLLLSLSRLTDKPIHCILQGNILLSNEVFKRFAQLIPDEGLRETTSISKTIICYPPYANYWNRKALISHQLEGSLNQKDGSLEEYMINDHLSRIVTEVNNTSGKYQSCERNNKDVFCIMGYTSKDYHKVFNTPSVVCLPLCNTKEIKEKINDWELKKYAGLLNESETNNCIQLIQNIQRVLEPIKIINPFIDQLDLQTYFENDVKKIRQFLQITNLITMLHQCQLQPKKKDGQMYFEVQPEYMLATLELFKELWVCNYDELYFQVLCTLKQIKTLIKKENPNDVEATFTEKEMCQKLKLSPATINRHITKLTLHNKLERVSGNNRIGFTYKCVSWSEHDGQNEKLEAFINEIKNLSS